MARVLVAEPDHQIRQLIAGILSDFGHHVQQCETVRDARACLKRTRFDVLATDLVLEPDKRSGDLPRRLPVLTLCGHVFSGVSDKYRWPPRLPDKPFRFSDLSKLVAAIAGCTPIEHPLAA